MMMTPYTLADTPAAGKTVSPPPSVNLDYVVRANYSAMSIGGTSNIKWKQSGSEYATQSSARGNLVGQLLDTSSKGIIGTKGLKPSLFTEKRRNRDETRTIFDQDSKALKFSDSGESLFFSDGIQDQASIVWQLVSMARAQPENFTPGKKLTFMVSGRNRIDQWDFTIVDEITFLTALGEIKAVHLIRTDKKGKTTEVWLAPDREWYPVKLVFFDKKGLRLEQIIKKITPG
ncbi:MAG: DUF3108 domain-containing protein [Oxalobacter sp.]|nr:DUF3108 domain-containing protein [Oxalobacter sp.]